MNQVILVAHGEGGRGTFSIPKVKTITRANTNLSFEEAKDYLHSTTAWPEYSSTSFGEFGPLNDVHCKELFNKVPTGSGIVSTGLRRGGDVGGVPIYVLRGPTDIYRDDISNFIRAKNITSLVLLACRG